LNQNYQDLCNNIVKYSQLRDTLNNDKNSDFSGNIPFLYNGDTNPIKYNNSTLNDEMQKDSKLMIAKINDLFIAGTILTSTLLICAIYLGRK
jgi:hypothetical protein